MILVRQYENDCDCSDKLMYDCRRHAATKPLDKWEPWTAYGAHVASIYDRHPPKQSMSRAKKRGGFWGIDEDGKPTGILIESPDAEIRVVYFDTDDLLDVTWDADAAYQQAEAKMLAAGAKAEEMRRLAESPSPIVPPEPKKRRRKQVSQ